MGCIRVLDEATVGKIAAGEVIERPASVVKELVENAIDAGATRVEIEIKNGGRSFIRVTDNGSGMGLDDLRLAVMSHATSKIATADDLDCLTTLGFRGEALPSVAAVAEMEIATRLRGQEKGYILETAGGAVKGVKEAGLPEGTTVIVTDLFGSVPARLKYLKSIPTEAGYTADVLGRLAIAHPQISFRLLHHEYEILFTPGSGSFLDAVTAVFGRDIAREMLPLEPVSGAVGVTGYLGKPSIARTTRHYELAYLNSRSIRSRTVGAAVEKAFHSLLPIARYPFAVVFLDVDPGKVDVNVHPTKAEVRFADEAAVFRAVHEAARRTLAGASLIYSWRGEAGPQVPAAAAQASKPDVAADTAPNQASLPLAQSQPAAARTREHFVALGVAVNGTYLLARDEEGMLLVDQHAAHERILYDRYTAHSDRELGPQRLLLPATVNLSFQQARILAERLPIFAELGFGLEPFGPNTYLLRSLPAALCRTDGARLVIDLLDELMHQPSVRDAGTVRASFLANMACHAAVKAGDVLSAQEMQALLDDLAATASPFTCPHGRPTAIRLSWDEIARRFKRR
ncbi:MAG: DNA mismatch repair endonuclease MutL [Bacteroidota bacterium]